MATVQGYTQQVGKTAAVSTPNVNVSAAGGYTKPVNFNTFNKGLGDVVKAINAAHEEDDKQAIVAAMDNYNNNMNDILSGENGLLNTKMEEANGIVDKFAEQQGKARESILGGTKLHFAANAAALDHYLANQANAAMNKVRAHEAQQKQAVTDAHYNNLNASNIDKAIAAYGDINQLKELTNNQKMLTNLTYGSRGADFEEATNRKAIGAMVGSALQTAIANNDYGAAQKIVDELGGYMPASQKMQYEKLSYAKQENKWMQDIVKNITASGGDINSKLAMVDKLASRNVIGFEGSRKSMVDMVRIDQKDVPYYINSENSKSYFGQSLEGTSCMATMGFGPLKNSPYKGCYNVDDAVAIARENNQLIDGNSGYKPQAGDLAVVNGGNHVVMVTENGGTIQNGKSGRNGKGGVWESEQSPAQMFGKVDYYIRTSDYNQSTTGSKSVEVTAEQKEKLRNMIISEHNKANQINNIELSDFEHGLEQTLFADQKNGLSAEDAYKKYVDKSNYADKDHYTMAEKAFKSVYGNIGGKSGNGSGNGGKVDSGVSKMTVYEIQKLIEQGEFSGERGTIELQDYLENCVKNGELSLKDMVKCRELNDDWLKGEGAYKLNWDYLDAAVLAAAGLKSNSPAEERKRVIAEGRAAILQFAKKDWKPTVPGQTIPTDDEIMQAIKPKLQKQLWFTYVDPNAGFFERSKKGLEVSEARLNKAGYTKIKDENEFQVRLYRADGVEILKPKEDVLALFGQKK